MRPLPALALVVASGGPKFHLLPPNAPQADAQFNFGAGTIEFGTVSRLVAYLNSMPEQAAQPIVDETGLAGRYRIVLDVGRASGALYVPTRLLVTEQLGLKFVPTKQPVNLKYVVIESARPLRGKWVGP